MLVFCTFVVLTNGYLEVLELLLPRSALLASTVGKRRFLLLAGNAGPDEERVSSIAVGVQLSSAQ